LDLVTLLRNEMAQQPHLLEPFAFEVFGPAMVQAAAA
jgi:hypothetical protein